MEIEDFENYFMKKEQWHEAQEREKCCAQCNSFNPWLRKKVVCELTQFLLGKYGKEELGECVAAGKLAFKCLEDARYSPMLTQANGHCLLYRKLGVINVPKRAVFTLLKRLTKLPKTPALV
jgi:hypothetical protein